VSTTEGGAGPAAPSPAVVAVSRSAGHRFSKQPVAVVRVLAGIGVEGDCHAGRTVQHLSRVRRDPSQPNLRQVHLIGAELLAELAEEGYDVPPGGLGENVLTSGIDLHALSRGTRLRMGTAMLAVTGLRNPCRQIDAFRTGLLSRGVGRDDSGRVHRRAGVMAVVLVGGTISPGDLIGVDPPAVGDAGGVLEVV